MDDNGIEEEFTDSTAFRMTPQGWFMTALMKCGADLKTAKEEWAKFEAFCVRRAAEDSEASHAALVFDGAGGVCIGVEQEVTEQD